MNQGRTVFAQLMDFIPHHEFSRCVKRHGGNHRVRSFSCWDQFLCMAFAQLTCRESLRDVETCLRTMQSKLYHLGFRGNISRSTLADANETRDWRIYADFAQVLISKARQLYSAEEFAAQLDQTTYALDCTTIDLCLSLFPWAQYREKNAGLKIHTLLDLRGNIPAFIKVTTAKVHEVNILDDLIFEPGAMYVLDRAYLDFDRLYRVKQSLAFFIIRPRKNFQFQRLSSQAVDKSSGVQCDQVISLCSFYPKKGYPDALRRIRFLDFEHNKRLVFLSNNFQLPALTVAQLYKYRWQVELFFKWIKQHLRIKKFYGISDNAIRTQIWIAVSIYVLVAIIRKQLNLELSLYTILQILSVALFEKMPIRQVLTELNCTIDETQICKQLIFNNF